MTDTTWNPASSPPDSARRVMMRFDDDGSRDATGFYWRFAEAWYKSAGSKARQESVHPVAWRELKEGE
jgi:hypothetical protein